ncbi:MAG: 50S ribosomal protein L21 [Acidiferrobacteraceae bacterium]
MYAVIESGGKQYRVSVGDVIRVEKLREVEGASVAIDRVLMVADEQVVQVGSPVLSTTVTATVRGHGRGDKIRVFKTRRRKHYRKHAGHRQHYTELEITAIGGTGETPVSAKD